MIYQDFNMMTNIDTAELVNIIPFKDGNNWYLELIYEYKNHKGKHAVIFPKAALPFAQKGFPALRNFASIDGICSTTYICCNCSMPLYESNCTLATERGIKDPAYYKVDFDEHDYKSLKTCDNSIRVAVKRSGHRVKVIQRNGELYLKKV